MPEVVLPFATLKNNPQLIQNLKLLRRTIVSRFHTLGIVAEGIDNTLIEFLKTISEFVRQVSIYMGNRESFSADCIFSLHKAGVKFDRLQIERLDFRAHMSRDRAEVFRIMSEVGIQMDKTKFQ